MKILIIGSGAREHALVKALKRSPRVTEVLVAPGNAGMAEEATCVAVAADNLAGLAELAVKEKVALTVVGPELPLTLGVVDLFQSKGLKILGPSKAAAVLEGSKVYTKEFLKKYGIPTARYKVFSEPEAARRFIKENAETRWVVKADGLAAGKGVIVTQTADEALEAVDRVLLRKEFGEQRAVVEEFLEGEELSFMVLCDGIGGLALASSQDHKRLADGDRGPNTGGMGAYSPAPLMTESLSDEILRQIIAPTLAGMREEGRPFVGILYAGLMIVKGRPLVLEFNVRFGDPEAEVLLPRLESDWLELFEAALRGELTQVNPKWSGQSAVCVVLAAAGYPTDPKKGDVIRGIPEAEARATVFHGGTARKGSDWLTAGGRVLTVTALGDSLEKAVQRCYQAVSSIRFNGMQYRKDIAARGMNRPVTRDQ